jgi:hypothetical protein
MQLMYLGLNNDFDIVDHHKLSTYLDAHHPDTITLINQPILFSAIEANNPALVELLLKRGANINSTHNGTEQGMSPLIFALYKLNSRTDNGNKIINEIVKYKPDLDIVDHVGETALMTACWWAQDNEPLILKLIELGADVHKITYSDKSHHSALSIVCRNGIQIPSVQKKLIELDTHKSLIAKTGASEELLSVSYPGSYNQYLTRELVNAGATINNGTITNILKHNSLADIWLKVTSQLKEKDALPIFKDVMEDNKEFAKIYLTVDANIISNNDFTTAATINNCTGPIKRCLFNLLFGQFNRKKLNKYIAYKIIDFVA